MPISVSSNTRQSSGATPEPGRGDEEWLGVRLAFQVVASADQGVEAVEELQREERRGHRLPCASGHHRERDLSVVVDDVFQHLRDGREPPFVEKLLFFIVDPFVLSFMATGALLRRRRRQHLHDFLAS